MSEYSCYFLDGQNQGEVRLYPTPLQHGTRTSPVELEVKSLGGRRPVSQSDALAAYTLFAIPYQGQTYFVATQKGVLESEHSALKEALGAGLQPQPMI